jgi:hypothetical protein
VEDLEGNDKNFGHISAIDALTIDDSNRLKSKVVKLESESSKIDQLQGRLNKLQVGQKETNDKVISLINSKTHPNEDSILRGQNMRILKTETTYPESGRKVVNTYD